MCKKDINTNYHSLKKVWYTTTGNYFPLFFFLFQCSKKFFYCRLHDGGFTDTIDGLEPIPPKWYKWLDDIPPMIITLDMKFVGEKRKKENDRIT